MTNREIIDYIDRGANYYVSLFGRAEHMEIVQREHYSLVRPKGDVFGIRFVYDVRLEGLPLQRQKELAAEIHALGMPVWLNLGTSPEAFQAFTGREKQDVPQDSDGESYLAMLPGDTRVPGFSPGDRGQDTAGICPVGRNSEPGALRR